MATATSMSDARTSTNLPKKIRKKIWRYQKKNSGGTQKFFLLVPKKKTGGTKKKSGGTQKKIWEYPKKNLRVQKKKTKISAKKIQLQLPFNNQAKKKMLLKIQPKIPMSKY